MINKKNSSQLDEKITNKTNEGFDSKKILSSIGELVKICIIAAAIIVPVRFLLIQPFYVKGASMEPNFHENDYLIVDELSFRFRNPERGEVIVFRYPEVDKKYLIKRVIAVPGETVEIKNAQVTIYNKENPQGFSLSENYLNNKTVGDVRYELKENQYFILGDNRMVSYDSEDFGPIDRNQIIGRVLLRGWPAGKAGIINNPNYNF